MLLGDGGMYIKHSIEGQVRFIQSVHLVHSVVLQTDNFYMFLCQQMERWKTSVAWWANGKRIKENRLLSCFPFSVWNGSIYIHFRLQQRNGNCHFPLVPFHMYVFIVCCKRKRKWKFVFLGRQSAIAISVHVPVYCLLKGTVSREFLICSFFLKAKSVLF